jgi:CheY-like chemotaxis protein
MNRILLADDSLHAQRMGDRILREEGFEVVIVTDGASALVRLEDFDPDLVLADVYLPEKSGYEICTHIKSSSKFRHTRVVLTAGALESIDETEARRVRADAVIRKPFEASALISTIRPLLEAAEEARKQPELAPVFPEAQGQHSDSRPATPPPATLSTVDPEAIRAAITLALDAALPAMIDEITEKVLVALGH